MNYEKLYALGDAKRAKQQAVSVILRRIRHLGEYDDNLIKGLCPKQDSCDQCRAARRNDPNRQLHLMKKWKLEAISANSAVQSDLEGRLHYDDEQWVAFYNNWTAMINERLHAYNTWLKGIDVPLEVKITVQ